MVRIKSGQVSTQDTVGFCLRLFRFVLGAACLSNLCGGLPRLVKIRFAFFVVGASRPAFSAFSLRHCAVVFLGFRGSVGRRLAFFFLSLSSLGVPFVFFWSLVRPHFF